MTLSRKFVKNRLIDLSFIGKLAYYFLWPLLLRTRPFRRRFAEDGYVLKYQQANYYAVVGFSVAIITVITANYSSDLALIVWIVGFVIAFVFDIGYNRPRQINYLQKKID